MISKKSLVAVLDKSIFLTITAPNDNANQDPVQCALELYIRIALYKVAQGEVGRSKFFFGFGQIFSTCEKNPQFSNFSKYQGGPS
jgi:hypothetical protein